MLGNNRVSLVLGVALILFGAAGALRAQELTREVEFNIPPQSLAAAVLAFSDQSGIQIVTSGADVSKLSTPGVSGRLSVSAGLTRLLGGTRLSFATIGASTVALVSKSLEEVRATDVADRERSLVLAQGPVTQAPATSAPPTADASPSSEADVSEITVTGSRIQRRDATSVGPISTLTSEDIAIAAPTSVGDLLQALPSVGVSLNSNGTQGTSFGVSSINLRYLGSAEGSGNRTLVLVDGHRFVSAVGGRGFRDFVDLNTIPLGIIERVEVLKDGASAIYGADAIAGVVNIQTKKRLDGFEMQARVGATDRGDNENYSGFVNWGASGDRLSTLLSLSYNNTKPILTTDRDLTQRALTPLTAPPPSNSGLFTLPRLAGNTYFGTPAGFATGTTSITPIPGAGSPGAGSAADNAFRVASLPADDFNQMTQGLYAAGPSERAGFFGRLAFAFTPQLNGHIEALYSWRNSTQLFSPPLIDIRGSNGFLIAADQAFNPFGTANGVPAQNALAFGADPSVPAASRAAFRVQRLVPEVGNRLSEQTINTYRVAAGLDGTFDLAGEWRWESFASYAENKAEFISENQLNLDNIYQSLLSPAACAAIAGCQQLNIFGPLSADQADYIRFNGTDRQKTTQTNFALNLSRDLFKLPAGPLGFAGGYEYRKESAWDVPDPEGAAFSTILPLVNGQPQLSTNTSTRSPTRGSYDLNEIYAEISAPLLAGLPAVHRLELDAAIRYSDYSTVGGKATTKFGVAWQPVEALLVRGTYSEGFRAPSILELYQGNRQINFQGVDPCNGGGAGKPGCAGVPSTYNQAQFNNGLIAGATAGNTSLAPETADTYSAGIVFTPRSVSGLSMSADWFEITVKDAIATNSATNILNSCANSGTFCDLIARGPLGEVTQLTQAVVNLSRIEVGGVDATTRYVFDTKVGNFEAALDASWLEKFKTFVPQPDGTVAVDERAGKSDQPRSTFPRWKGQASLRYRYSGVQAGWKVRYIGASDDIPNNLVNGGRVPNIFYHDVQLGITLRDSETHFALGIDNVFDRQPPASAANNPINFDIYTYDVRGRYFYAMLAAKF